MGYSADLTPGKCKKQAVNAGPAGQYCANVAGAADVKILVDDSSHADITASVLGEAKVCKKEEYAFDATSGVITVTHIKEQSDCVNKAFAEFGGDPSDLVLKYDASANAISLSVMGYSADLKPTLCGKLDA